MRREPPTDLKPYFLTLDDLETPVEWRRVFGNDRPVEIDVGSGRGLFLVRAGIEQPETNFLGIELDYREGRRAARRIQKRQMTSVRVWGGDVRRALSLFIPPHSVSAAHVYFPDPWWKRKHKKRRLFTDEFVDQLAAVLVPGGYVHSWTDVEEYFQVISALMDHHPQFEAMSAPAERQPVDDVDYRTSFERKKRKLGMSIYRGQWRRLRLGR